MRQNDAGDGFRFSVEWTYLRAARDRSLCDGLRYIRKLFDWCTVKTIRREFSLQENRDNNRETRQSSRWIVVFSKAAERVQPSRRTLLFTDVNAGINSEYKPSSGHSDRELLRTVKKEFKSGRIYACSRANEFSLRCMGYESDPRCPSRVPGMACMARSSARNGDRRYPYLARAARDNGELQLHSALPPFADSPNPGTLLDPHPNSVHLGVGRWGDERRALDAKRRAGWKRRKVASVLLKRIQADAHCGGPVVGEGGLVTTRAFREGYNFGGSQVFHGQPGTRPLLGSTRRQVSKAPCATPQSNWIELILNFSESSPAKRQGTPAKAGPIPWISLRDFVPPQRHEGRAIY